MPVKWLMSLRCIISLNHFQHKGHEWTDTHSRLLFNRFKLFKPHPRVMKNCQGNPQLHLQFLKNSALLIEQFMKNKNRETHSSI
jgi:hypothetical protein